MDNKSRSEGDRAALSDRGFRTRNLFPEAKRHRRRVRLMGGVIVVAGVALAAGLLAAQGGGPPASRFAATDDGSQGSGPASLATSHRILLRGNGIGDATFGQSEAVAISELSSQLGAANSQQPKTLANGCTVDSNIRWPALTAFFFRGSFVGYWTSSLLGGPNDDTIPNAITINGVRVGQSLATAQKASGGNIVASGTQGGSWSSNTSTGVISGLLTGEPNSTYASRIGVNGQTWAVPTIADISAGSVGCPGETP
jgi:hypothetical protein